MYIGLEQPAPSSSLVHNPGYLKNPEDLPAVIVFITTNVTCAMYRYLSNDELIWYRYRIIYSNISQIFCYGDPETYPFISQLPIMKKCGYTIY